MLGRSIAWSLARSVFARRLWEIKEAGDLIRPVGTRSEAADVIMDWGRFGASSEPFLPGRILCKDFSLFYGGRRCPTGGVVETVKVK